MKKSGMLWCLLALVSFVRTAEAAVAVEKYVKPDRFTAVKISPNGEHYAIMAPVDGQDVVVVMRRADNKFTARIQGMSAVSVENFWWISDSRLVASMSQRIGVLETPYSIGQLVAVNADGSAEEQLSGPSKTSINAESVGGTYNYSVLAHTLPGDDRYILAAAYGYGSLAQTRIERVDTFRGSRAVIATAPVKRAQFTFNNKGGARFCSGAGQDNNFQVFYRASEEADWQSIGDEAKDGYSIEPIGFSADDKTAYAIFSRTEGPDALFSMSVETGKWTELYRDNDVSPYSVIYDASGYVPVGLRFMRDGIRTWFIDEESRMARLYRGLERAFPGQAVSVGSSTADGRLNVVKVSSDKKPGDFYLFDLETGKAGIIYRRGEALTGTTFSSSQAISLKARDGMVLHGYVNRPVAKADKPAAMVVLVHGGPFGVFNDWTFDRETQLLTEAGYAVLRLNFRGSGNYGQAYKNAGARQWGLAMQDDLTDATRWAIEQKIAEPDRIAIMGGSYGGYAALMGLAKEPGLYRCAIGFVGVYDLPALVEDDISSSKWIGNFQREWIGEPESLHEQSPVKLAARIKAPVLLIAGGEDWRVPVEQSEDMEAALKKAGVPVETLYKRTEGHGFYLPESRREYYLKVLDFLHRHLGGDKGV